MLTYRIYTLPALAMWRFSLVLSKDIPVPRFMQMMLAITQRWSASQPRYQAQVEEVLGKHERLVKLVQALFENLVAETYLCGGSPLMII